MQSGKESCIFKAFLFPHMIIHCTLNVKKNPVSLTIWEGGGKGAPFPPPPLALLRRLQKMRAVLQFCTCCTQRQTHNKKKQNIFPHGSSPHVYKHSRVKICLGFFTTITLRMPLKLVYFPFCSILCQSNTT